MIEMDTSGPIISEADVEHVEEELGVQFPDDYRSFLLEHNGGEPASTCAVFPTRKGGRATMSTFYSIEPTREFEGLLYRTLRNWTLDAYAMPRTLVPVGSDSFGNLICLGVSGDEVGKVYFFDMDRLPEKPPDKPWAMMKGYVKLADSFGAFLDMLGPNGEPPAP